jgi:hypothetical protein
MQGLSLQRASQCLEPHDGTQNLDDDGSTDHHHRSFTPNSSPKILVTKQQHQISHSSTDTGT